MATADELAGYLPSINTGTVGSIFMGLVIFIVVMLIAGGGVGYWAYSFINKKKYKHQIRIFEKVDGRVKLVSQDIATEMKIGDAGDTVFFFKKFKRYQPRPVIQTGIDTYWFFRRQDGELINFGLEDIDLNMRRAGVFYLDMEMRQSRTALSEIIKKRYERETWWQRHGAMVMSIVFLTLITVGMVFVLGQILKITNSLDAALQTMPPLLEKAERVIGAVDNVCSGSGVSVAP